MDKFRKTGTEKNKRKFYCKENFISLVILWYLIPYKFLGNSLNIGDFKFKNTKFLNFLPSRQSSSFGGFCLFGWFCLVWFLFIFRIN